MIRRPWLKTVVGAFMIACAILGVSGCSGTHSKGGPADHGGAPADQLDHKINLPPTPEYYVQAGSDASASAISCEEGVHNCLAVTTETTRAAALASITEDAFTGYNISKKSKHQRRILPFLPRRLLRHRLLLPH